MARRSTGCAIASRNSRGRSEQRPLDFADTLDAEDPLLACHAGAVQGVIAFGVGQVERFGTPPATGRGSLHRWAQQRGIELERPAP